MSQKIIIIGAGPAGEAAARTVQKLQSESEIFLIEREEAGGLCLNKGCIPSKTLLENVRKELEAEKKIDWKKIQAIKGQVVSGIRSQLERSLKTQKIQLLHGTATFKDENSIEVQTADGVKVLPFDKAIITTGTDIFYPPPLDKFKEDLLNSDKILELEQTPKSVVIVGGGAVGLEFACLLNAAGSKVTVIELQEGILPGEDAGVVTQLTRIFESRGIDIKTSTKVTSLEKESQGWIVGLSNNETIQSEHVMASVGRTPNPNPLSCDKARIKCVGNRIQINQHLQTSNPNIFAAGDVTTTRLAHAAAAMAQIAAKNAVGQNETYDDSLTPRCLYSWPEVASVGEWKYSLEEKNIPGKSSRASFYRGSAKALAAGETEGFVQIISHAETKKILGAQIIGSHATELIHIVAVAIKAGMTTTELGQISFAHPTLSEMIKEACHK